jgi:hypothetical protein
MRRLGYTKFAAQGGDWGAMVADVMGKQAPPELLGIHVTVAVHGSSEHRPGGPDGELAPGDLSVDERRACDQLAFFYTHDLGYAQEMSHRPQTIYALEDSPVGLAALAHRPRHAQLRADRARLRQPDRGSHARRSPRQHHAVLADHTAVSSARIYWENKKYTFFAPKNVTIPVAVSAFPTRSFRPHGVGGEGVPQPHLLQQGRQGRPLRRVGAAGALLEELRAAFRLIR